MEGLNHNYKLSHENQIKYWVAYSKIVKIGPSNFKKLIDFFVDLQTAWQANFSELIDAGLDEDLANEIIIQRSTINPEAEMELLHQADVRVVTLNDKNYPANLKETFNPPPLIYYRGSLDFLKNNCLAVVGTRKFSAYGAQITADLVSQLSQNGLTIVSGLALGIDALAHQAALSAQGQTIAVLGSGVDKACVYPSSHRYLADKIIASGGGIISEYPIGTNPTKYTFPMRNRIISGLSRGVLVIEAPESSGALITAKYALEQNRDIFAVPGSIYSLNSTGTNNLIKQGAKLVLNADDILTELNMQTVFCAAKNEPKFDKSEEKMIWDLLSKEPAHIDKIKKMSTLNINVLLSALTVMELKGLIKDTGGRNYIKN